jgi:hypothetical protein
VNEIDMSAAMFVYILKGKEKKVVPDCAELTVV